MATIFADSNRAQLIYAQSVNGWNTIPTTGKTRAVRFTGATINAEKKTETTEEIRSDRQVVDHIEVGLSSNGEVNVEFSAGSHDDFMAAFAYGAWTRPMTMDQWKGTVVSWGTTGAVYVAGLNLTGYLTAGHYVRTEGFVNPSNNGHFLISTVTYDSVNVRSVITMSTTTGIIEAGNISSALFDANDVVIWNSTAIRAGTSGASAFDSNSTNAFASAVAAGQLNVGQKIFVESPLGFQAGSFSFSAQPASGDTVVIFDNTNTVTFQFGAGTSTVPTLVYVPIGASLAVTMASLVAAINAAKVDVFTVATGTTPVVVAVKNLNNVGGTIAKGVDVATVNTVTAFTAGDATQRGVFTITNITNDVLSVTPAPATNANASAAKITIKGSMLRNPGLYTNIVPQDFTLETGFTDAAIYYLASGLRIGGMKYEVTSGAILKGSYTFMGANVTRGASTTFGNTANYTVLGTTSTSIANATTNVGAITLNGTALSTALQSITFEGENNLREQLAVSNKFPVGIGAGRMDIKGTAKAYFANGTLWDHFINHDYVSLSFPIADADLNTYTFTMPSVIFSADKVSPSAGNQDVFEEIEYMVRRDPVTNCQFQIDRFSNTFAVSG